MLRKAAGLVVSSMAGVWLAFVWRMYVRSQDAALTFIAWTFIYLILWVYIIILRSRQNPESESRARVLGLIVFIPAITYFIQRLMGGEFPMIEMAAALSIYGLFLSWGWRLFRQE